jgi:hypothetical protein
VFWETYPAGLLCAVLDIKRPICETVLFEIPCMFFATSGLTWVRFEEYKYVKMKAITDFLRSRASSAQRPLCFCPVFFFKYLIIYFLFEFSWQLVMSKASVYADEIWQVGSL